MVEHLTDKREVAGSTPATGNRNTAVHRRWVLQEKMVGCTKISEELMACYSLENDKSDRSKSEGSALLCSIDNFCWEYCP